MFTESADRRETVADAYAMLGRDIESLRSLIMDIQPPDLAGPGLAEAARDLTTRVESAGTVVDLDVPTDPPWSEATSRLVYRVLQEGLRNVAKHARATRATRAATARSTTGTPARAASAGQGPTDTPPRTTPRPA